MALDNEQLPKEFEGIGPVKYIMGVDLAKPGFKDKSYFAIWMRRSDGCHMLIDEGRLDATTPQGIDDQIKAIAAHYDGIKILEERQK